MGLIGKDIALRKWQIEDAEDMFEYAKSPNIGPNAGWKPHDNVHESKRIIKMLQEIDGEYAIVHIAENKVIGGIKMVKSIMRHNVNAYELGYVLNESYQKKGLVNQAAKLIIEHAFKNMNAQIIEVYHYPYNINSKRTIELLGFKYEGLIRRFNRNSLGIINDAVCYSMTEDEYNELLKGSIKWKL